MTRGQRRALGILACASLVALLWLAMPVGLGLFLGTLVAFTVEPFYQRLCARLHRPVLAATLCAVGSCLAVFGALAALAVAIASRGAEAAASIATSLSRGGPLHHALGPVEGALRRAHLDPGDLGGRVREAATGAFGRAASAIATVAGMTMNALLTLFFLALSTFFVLRHWRSLTARAETMLPLHRMHTRALFREFRRAGRTILLGTLVTGFAQGLLATIGFAIFRVPHAPLLGALTAIASLVPAVGTLLVWVPAAAWLIGTGHVGAGVGLLVYCSLTVIVVSDYVIRPRLVGRGEQEIPTLLTFIALFGGAEVFGVIGLVLGPVLVSLSIAILRTWEQVANGPRAVDSIPDGRLPPPTLGTAHEERISH